MAGSRRHSQGGKQGWKAHWEHFRRLHAGKRFQARYREQRRVRDEQPAWRRWLALLLVPVLLVAGVVLMFIPGPAILFFALAGALLASHSLVVARGLDAAEVTLRSAIARARARWRRSSLADKASALLVLLAAAAGTIAAAVTLLHRS